MSKFRGIGFNMLIPKREFPEDIDHHNLGTHTWVSASRGRESRNNDDECSVCGLRRSTFLLFHSVSCEDMLMGNVLE